MELALYIVDAFTKEKFKGNAAAVVPLNDWLPDDIMQAIAMENNLSETAFLKKNTENDYHIRWFSPLCEVDFCGHATLAASFVLFSYFNCTGSIRYSTEKVGELRVSQNDDKQIVMDFPNLAPKVVENVPDALLSGLSVAPEKVLISAQAYFAIYPSEQDVVSLEYNSEQLKQLAPYDVVVTAQSDHAEYDIVSRYFWPANGGDEDPVTGSIHAGLAPYWASVLGKQSLVARQASKRGGIIHCKLLDKRVIISGHAVLYLKGTIAI